MRFATLVAIFLVLGCSGNAAARQGTCPGGAVTVVAESADEVASVCAAVQAGNAFLGTIGLQTATGLTITLYNELPDNGQVNAIGYYDPRSSDIRLLNYAAALKASLEAPPAFGVAMSPSLWRSFVVH